MAIENPVNSFLTAFSATQNIIQKRAEEERNREEHPVRMGLLRQQLSYQQLIAEKAAAMFPFELEKEKLGVIKAQKDIQNAELDIAHDTMRNKKIHMDLNEYMSMADSRRTKNEVERQMNGIALEALPFVRQSTLNKAKNEVTDQKKVEDANLANSVGVGTNLSGQHFWDYYKDYPNAKFYTHDMEGNPYPEESAKKNLTLFRKNFIEGDIEVEQYRRKVEMKPTATTTLQKNIKALIDLKDQYVSNPDPRLKEQIDIFEGSFRKNDAIKQAKNELYEAVMSGQVDPSMLQDVAMLSVIDRGDPIMMTLFNRLSQDNQWGPMFKRYVDAVNSTNLAYDRGSTMPGKTPLGANPYGASGKVKFEQYEGGTYPAFGSEEEAEGAIWRGLIPSAYEYILIYDGVDESGNPIWQPAKNPEYGKKAPTQPQEEWKGRW